MLFIDLFHKFVVSPTVRTLCKENCVLLSLAAARQEEKNLLLSCLTDPNEGLPRSCRTLYILWGNMRLIHA